MRFRIIGDGIDFCTALPSSTEPARVLTVSCYQPA